jgi:hypothetical protein
MDKRLRRTIMTLHANGLSASDIAKRFETDTRKERKDYILTAMTIEDVLREMCAVDPTRRIPQKPEIQPDMPKRFIPLYESEKKRKKLTYRKPTVEQREWHEIVCGVSKNGRQLLKSGSRHLLERRIVEYLEKGYVQIGNISTDFYCDGELYMALVQKKEDTQ